MAYVSPNYKSKRDLKKALAAGKQVSVFQPAIGNIPENGLISIEGPHFPVPHSWYGQGRIVNGVLVSVS